MSVVITKDRLLDLLQVSSAIDAFPRHPILLNASEIRELRASIPDNDVLEETRVNFYIHGTGPEPWEEAILQFAWMTGLGLLILINREVLERLVPLYQEARELKFSEEEFPETKTSAGPLTPSL